MNKNEIKICHITSAHHDGDDRIFHKECVSTAKAGYIVYEIVPGAKSRSELGVNIIGIDNKTDSRWKRIINTTHLVYRKALSINADIYHFHDPEFLPFGLKLKNRGKKVIYDAHEDLPRQIESKYWIKPILRNLVAHIIEKYENSVAKKLDYIITATPYIRERFVKINPNSVDINNFPLLQEFTVSDWESKKLEVCYVGSISEIRGISKIIDAIQYTDDIKLHLAGAYSPENYILTLKGKSGWQNVIEYGYVERRKVAEIYNQSIAGIVTIFPEPNYINSQAVKMFEYMAAGIPVICSDFPLWKTIIEKNNCGICVDPLNPKEIADAIKFFVKNKKKAEEMGKNGRKAVEEKYNWAIEEKKLLKIYSKIV